MKTVSSNLGHATTAFTMDRYGHVTETMMKNSADKTQRFMENIEGFLLELGTGFALMGHEVQLPADQAGPGKLQGQPADNRRNRG